MYLICCPNIYAQSIIDDLANVHISGIELPLMNIEDNNQNLQFLDKEINNFDYIIFPSGTAIEYAKEAIIKASTPQFITVGDASAAKLNKLTGQRIIYPENISGGIALFNEKLSKLNLMQKKVLVIKGCGGNTKLYAKLIKTGVNFMSIDIYKRVLQTVEPDHLKKMLLIQGLQGIIITSSGLAEWLFNQGLRAKCLHLLKNQLFVTIHPQIKHKLIKLRAKKFLLTQIPKKSAVADLIKKLKLVVVH